jgi:TetR/AcrR family transcriptional repressor of bet genes
MAMIEGLWVDYLLHPEDFDRVRAIRICFRFLAALYPQHFDLNGALTVQAHQEAV